MIVQLGMDRPQLRISYFHSLWGGQSDHQHSYDQQSFHEIVDRVDRNGELGYYLPCDDLNAHMFQIETSDTGVQSVARTHMEPVDYKKSLLKGSNFPAASLTRKIHR